MYHKELEQWGKNTSELLAKIQNDDKPGAGKGAHAKKGSSGHKIIPLNRLQ